jgi:DNA-binding MarR family transcriptional regulator
MSSMAEADPPQMTPLPDRAAMASALLLEQLIRLVYPERGPQDMHPGQWAALRYLSRTNAEASTVAGLARYLGVTLGPASRAVSALTRKGLVSGERDPKDKRSIRLTLTSAGTGLIAEDPLQRLGAQISKLPMAQRDAIIDGVRQLFAGLSGKDSAQHSLSFTVGPAQDDA